jgi:hypothetical protein
LILSEHPWRRFAADHFDDHFHYAWGRRRSCAG